MLFAMKVVKLNSQILKFMKFAMDFSEKENRFFTNLQYVESASDFFLEFTDS
jgi:hypothetical protein